MSIEEAAQAMFDTVNSNMADAISEISTRKGYDVRDFNLLSTGGGGPLCGVFVADILGMKKTIVPTVFIIFLCLEHVLPGYRERLLEAHILPEPILLI